MRSLQIALLVCVSLQHSGDEGRVPKSAFFDRVALRENLLCPLIWPNLRVEGLEQAEWVAISRSNTSHR